MAFDPTTSLFAGMTTEALQAALASAQQAYLALASGSKVVTVSYAQGDGSKSVTYTPTDMAKVAAIIRQLQQQLGIVCTARRAIGVRF